MCLLDESSVRSTPALTEDGDSSGCEYELNNDDDYDKFSCDNEQQNDANDDDDDDDEADAEADSEQLEADIMQQLGLFSWFSVPC